MVYKALLGILLLPSLWFSCEGQSKIVLSSRWFHPINITDSQSTVKAIEVLKPNRIDWTYTEDPRVVDIYKQRGLKFSLAINPQIPDSGRYTTGKHRIKTIYGLPFIAPWMKFKMTNPYWGCVNDPEFYNLFLNKSLQLAKLGPYAIFVDDAAMNARLADLKLIGCFCEICTKKFIDIDSRSDRMLSTDITSASLIEIFKDILFKQQLRIGLSNYEAFLLKSYVKFQQQSVIIFLTKWKKAMIASYQDMRFLTNNAQGKWNAVYSMFDGGIAEIGMKMLNVDSLDSIYKRADKLGKSQLLTLNDSKNLNNHLYLLQYNIKHGRDCLVPWDLFVHGLSGNDRLYFDLDKLRAKILNFKKQITK